MQNLSKLHIPKSQCHEKYESLTNVTFAPFIMHMSSFSLELEETIMGPTD